MDALTLAQDLMRYKLAPLPIRAGTKSAACKWRDYQERGPAAEELPALFESPAPLTVGVLCGAPSDRLLVLDCDSEAALACTSSNLEQESKHPLHFLLCDPSYPCTHATKHRSLASTCVHLSSLLLLVCLAWWMVFDHYGQVPPRQWTCVLMCEPSQKLANLILEHDPLIDLRLGFYPKT